MESLDGQAANMVETLRNHEHRLWRNEALQHEALQPQQRQQVSLMIGDAFAVVNDNVQAGMADVDARLSGLEELDAPTHRIQLNMLRELCSHLQGQIGFLRTRVDLHIEAHIQANTQGMRQEKVALGSPARLLGNYLHIYLYI